MPGYGRTPIREARQHLVIEGAVQIVLWSGVIVSRIEASIPLNLIEVRRELESITLAAPRARPSTGSTGNSKNWPDSLAWLSAGMTQASSVRPGIQ